MTGRKSTANNGFGWKAFWEQDRWKAGTGACLVVTDDDGDMEATST